MGESIRMCTVGGSARDKVCCCAGQPCRPSELEHWGAMQPEVDVPLAAESCPITGPKMYVANLPQSIQHQQIIDCFGKFGSVNEVFLLPRKALHSRAAFVLYHDAAAAVRAWTELHDTSPFPGVCHALAQGRRLEDGCLKSSYETGW